jgi:hypothetical protein
MGSKKSTHRTLSKTLVVIVVATLSLTGVTYAADNADITQVINPGTLTAIIRDGSGAPVASPAYDMTDANFSFTCSGSTGTLGSSSQRLYVDNPDAADNGWTLTLAATSGPTTLWQNAGSTQNFDFNDPTAAGCSDGADTDTRPGQLTVDPATGTLTADCGSCNTTSITKGSEAAFSQGTTDSVTLLNAAAGSSDIGRWYLTNVPLEQTIPAEQAADEYNIDMTITATAS